MNRSWRIGLTLWMAAAGAVQGAEAGLRAVAPIRSITVTASRDQPEANRYLAFPTLLRMGPDEVWIAYKAGRSHATDAGAALEVVQHALSTGTTKLLQRLPAPPPKLYQMGEFTRLPDGTVALFVDVQSVGWDGRNYRAGAEVIRWNPARRVFDPPTPLGVIDGVLYGYPFDFISEGQTTWQLIMSFGYHLPGGRWSVGALRSDDSGRGWRLVRNLSEEFGNLQINETGFARHAEGFIVATRAYDRIARLHRVDGEFRVRKQVELTGKSPFVHSLIGLPRLFVREGKGYLIGRNWTRPLAVGGKGEPSEMQLCLFRFDCETLALESCVILDNAEQDKVTDGYYVDVDFSGTASDTRLHVFTYKAIKNQTPDILRLDYRWAEVK